MDEKLLTKIACNIIDNVTKVMSDLITWIDLLFILFVYTFYGSKSIIIECHITKLLVACRKMLGYFYHSTSVLS